MIVEEAGAVLDELKDGSVVALGGAGLSRKPMGLLRHLVDRGIRDLTVVSFLGSVDVELLLAADAVAELHTAGVSLDGFGLAPAYRRSRQEGSVRVIEWSEGSLVASLEAASRRVPSMPTITSPESDLVSLNPWLTVQADPFTGVDVTYAKAIRPDVALLHVPEADESGNLYVAGDLGIDGLLARAAERTMVSSSRIVAEEPNQAAVSRIWVDAIVPDPDGAWPTACYPETLLDLDTISGWAASDGGDPEMLRAVP